MIKPVFKTGGNKRTSSNFAVDCREGDYLFKEGDLGTEMYIIQDGQVEIVKSLDGQPKRIAVLEKGDFFGEMSVLEDLPRTASARALKACRLLQINGSTFDQMLRSNPEIAVRMMRKLSGRLRRIDEEREEDSRPDKKPAPVAEPEEVTAQRLLHRDTGIEFPLSSSPESTIGRQDPVTGIDPEIDLTEVDTDRSTSRRHAKIHRRSGKFFLTEEIGTTNGTFINGTRLQTGVPFELNVGDEVQFGLVKLDFRAG